MFTQDKNIESGWAWTYSEDTEGHSEEASSRHSVQLTVFLIRQKAAEKVSTEDLLQDNVKTVSNAIS